MNIYENCPTLENDKIIIRLFNDNDCNDLFKVYSDKNALLFFNSDNCDGDNFYYSTKDKMEDAIKFWHMAYENGWFVRLSIIEKESSNVIGTVELCLRVSEDTFNNKGILRVDVKSDYENEEILYSIFSLITPKLKEMLGCNGVITKAPIYAIERIEAIKKVGYIKSKDLLIGKNGFKYDGYWMVN